MSAACRATREKGPSPSHHGTTQHPQPRARPRVVLRCLHSSTVNPVLLGTNRACVRDAKAAVCQPSAQLSTEGKVPCKPWRSAPAELHPCTEGKWRQDKGKLGKINRQIKRACRLIICSLLCNSNLMHPKCQNPSNLPPGGSTQLHSPNQNTWCTSG